MKVNALLDDVSDKSYINSEIAMELGVYVQMKQHSISVINGQVSSFVSSQVTFAIESENRSVDMKMQAFTSNHVA